MNEQIDCPHCGGSGKVAEDFLTEDHVATVFADYCKIFGWHLAYGVERYSECRDGVEVIQDTTRRSCYSSKRHMLPYAYFTRDSERRQTLMQADREMEKIAEAKEEKRKKAAEIKEHEDAADRLRAQLRAKP